MDPTPLSPDGILATLAPGSPPGVAEEGTTMTDNYPSALASRPRWRGMIVPAVVTGEVTRQQDLMGDAEQVYWFALDRRCEVCGNPVDPANRTPLVLHEGPSFGYAIDENVDTAHLHEDCARAALQQCPVLRKAVAAGRLEMRSE